MEMEPDLEQLAMVLKTTSADEWKFYFNEQPLPILEYQLPESGTIRLSYRYPPQCNHITSIHVHLLRNSIQLMSNQNIEESIEQRTVFRKELALVSEGMDKVNFHLFSSLIERLEREAQQIDKKGKNEATDHYRQKYYEWIKRHNFTNG